MSVVDEAQIDIKINADEVQASISKMMQALNSLSSSIQSTEQASSGLDSPFNDNVKSLREVSIMSNMASGSFGRMTANIVASVKNMIPSFTALMTSVASIKAVFSFSNEAIEFKRLADSAGISIERLSQFGTVAEGMGSSANSIGSAFANISKNMEQAKFGQGAFFDRDLMRQGLQVSVGGSPEETLMRIADKMKGLDSVKANMLAEKLGIPADLVPTLRQGRQAIKDMTDEAKPLYSQEDVERAYRVQRAITSLKNTFVELSSKLLSVLAPAVEAVSKGISWFFGLFSKYEGLGIAVMSGIALACIPVLSVLAKMAVATVVAFAPFFAIGAVIAGLATVFQDLWIGFKGGDSLIFGIVKKLDDFANKGGLLSSIFKVVWSSIRLIGESIWAIIKPVFKFIEALQEGLSLTEASKVAWDSLLEGITTLLQPIIDSFNYLIELPGKAISGISDWFGGLFGGGEAVTTEPIVPVGTTNNNANSVNITNNNNLTVNAQNASARQVQASVDSAMNATAKNIVAQSSVGAR